jgi:4,5-DOPA dioxygenase extradiol
VVEFSRWIESKVTQGDVEALFNYRSLAPHAHRAHPTDEHFLPLFFALGAAGQATRRHYLSREVMHSMLAMDAFTLQ